MIFFTGKKNNINILDWAQPNRSSFARLLSFLSAIGKLLPIVGLTRQLCMWIGTRIRLNFEVDHDRTWPPALQSASGGRQYSSILVTSGRHINIVDLHQRNKGCWLGLFRDNHRNAAFIHDYEKDLIDCRELSYWRLAGAILNSPHDIWVTGLFLQMRAPMRKPIETCFPTNDVHDYNK